MLLDFQISHYKLYRNFAISLIVLNLFLFSGIFESYWGVPKLVKYIFSLFAFYFIIKLYSSANKLKFINTIDLWVKYLFVFVSFVLLLTSFRLETLYIQEIFGERFYFMPYLIPIFFLSMKYNILFFKVLLNYSYYLLFGGVLIEIFVLLIFTNIEFYVRGLTSMLTFSLATFLLIQVSHLYKKKMVGRISFLYLFLFAIITAIWGRRGETIEPLFFLAAAFFIKTRSNDIGRSNKLGFIFFSIIFLVVTYFVVLGNQDKLYIFDRGFSQESFEQSRGGTIENFLQQFGSQSSDWFFGRGLNGEFRKFNFGENQLSRSIEIGYLNILLKGGLLYLIPMMYLFLRAFYLGFFRSNNDVSKSLSIIVLWQMIYMVSFGMANYSPYYILVWIAVGAGFDSSLRNKSNQEFSLVFNSL